MNKSSRGFTLIEVMVTLAVLAFLLMIGLPGMTTWLQNTQIRASAEQMQAGLQFARSEALRRNRTVSFQLVDSLAAGCALSATGTSWVVSLENVTGVCGDDESDGDFGVRILQKRSGAEGTPNATVDTGGPSSVVFSGLGRVSVAVGPPPITQIDVRNVAGDCQSAGGRMRCLRLTISNGGEVRMCDPAVMDNTDPRFC